MGEGEAPDDSDSDGVDSPVTGKEIKALVRRSRRSSGDAGGLKARLAADDRLESKDREQDIGLKKTYANCLLILLGVQLFIADGVFMVYAQKGVGWHLSAPVIDVWLGSTLVEVIGIVLVVARYLFPRRDQT